ncbi:unnamed protein product [Schistosoma mattheei]|uniref:Uncharacterized protein n=1 Tax=Schistosoma mattheei TaxID=31246 RepID=A0A183PMU4_9TREM|nr:unnamed protein product [Schistosoma mattheei]
MLLNDKTSMIFRIYVAHMNNIVRYFDNVGLLVLELRTVLFYILQSFSLIVFFFLELDELFLHVHNGP